MRITKHSNSTILILDKDGRIDLHLPYLKKPPPRHLEEFLILLTMWTKRDKQLIQRIESKILSPREKRERRKNGKTSD